MNSEAPEAKIQPRRPRAHWVTVLEKLVAPLSADPTKVYEWKRRDWYFKTRIVHGRFNVVALYAFGSFARGAADSGDLDIIVVVEPHTVWDEFLKHDIAQAPEVPVLKKAIWGQPRQVDIVVEAVNDHGRRNQFPEHRLVWSPDKPNLHENLAAIPVVEGAGRYERKADRLPFPTKLFDTRTTITPDGHRPGEEVLVEAIDRGELVSTFIPLEAIDAGVELTKKQQRVINSINDSKRPGVAPTMRYVFDSIRPPFVKGVVWTRRTTVLVNGHLVMFRRPDLTAQPLDDVNVTRMLFVPDVPKTLTAGIWQLERSPRHPVVKSFEEVELWLCGRAPKSAEI